MKGGLVDLGVILSEAKDPTNKNGKQRDKILRLRRLRLLRSE